MEPVFFPQTNTNFRPPPDMDESQVGTIFAHVGQVRSGNVDGSPIIITAWQPSEIELERIAGGAPIFVSFLSGALPPHMLTTSFEEAAMRT